MIWCMPVDSVTRIEQETVVEKFRPILLRNKQEHYRMSVYNELKELLWIDPHFLSKVTDVGFMDMAHKLSSNHPSGTAHLHLRQRKLVKSNIKSLLICFCAADGIIHKGFILPGRAINGVFCCTFLRWLRKDLRRKCPEKWNMNARPHTTFIVQQILVKKNMVVVAHPPYSPNLMILCNIFLFPKVKIKLKIKK